MKKSILIVDDQKDFPGVEATYARTLAEGLELVKSQPWDEVWLDYFLGWDTVEPLCEFLQENALPLGAIKPISGSHAGKELVSWLLQNYYTII